MKQTLEFNQKQIKMADILETYVAKYGSTTAINVMFSLAARSLPKKMKRGHKRCEKILMAVAAMYEELVLEQELAERKASENKIVVESLNESMH